MGIGEPILIVSGTPHDKEPEEVTAREEVVARGIVVEKVVGSLAV